MKPFFQLSPRHQKWGLFILLAGSLGFNLSMNPDHFNNIARNEETLHSMDLAQTAEPKAGEKAADPKADPKKDEKKDDKAAAAAEAKPAAAEATAKTDKKEDSSTKVEKDAKAEEKKSETTAAKSSPAPGEEKRPSRITKVVRGSKGVFKITVVEKDEVAYANIKALNKSSEGQFCPTCEFALTSSIDSLSDVTKELQLMADGKIDVTVTSESSSSEEEGKKTVQKPGEATDVDLAKWAEKCEKVDEENQLDCHKTRLIELSKYLKNTPDTDKFMKQYFVAHLGPKLREGFLGKTVKEMKQDKCADKDGTPLYSVRSGMVACENSEALDQANEMSEEILAGLRAGNSKSVVKSILALRAGSITAQMKYSQQLAIKGQQEGNMAEFMVGNQGLNPTRQSWLLDQANSNMLDSIEQMAGTKSQQQVLENMLEQQFYNPVSSMLNDMKNFYLNGVPGNPNQSHNLVDFMIPSIGDDRTAGSIPGNNGSTFTPGMNVPPSLLAGRSQNYRGSSLQPIGGNLSWLGARSPLFSNQSTVAVPAGTAPVLLQNYNQMLPVAPSATSFQSPTTIQTVGRTAR